VEWYKLKPTSWVISDLKSNRNPMLQSRALERLRELQVAGRLSKDELARIAERALAKQALPTHTALTGEMVKFLDDAYRAGVLNQKQKDQFFNQMQQLKLRVRQEVSAGDKIPWQIDREVRTPMDWSVRVTPQTVSIDGLLDGSPLYSSSTTTGVMPAGEVRGLAAPHDAGNHQLKLVGKVEVFRGWPGPADAPYWSRTIEFSQPFTVHTEFRDVKVIQDAKLDASVRAAIGPLPFEYRKNDPGNFTAKVRVRGLPAAVAFDVYARFAGREIRIGSLVQPAASQDWVHYFLAQLGETSPKSADVVLRSNTKLARETVDLDRIWSGELVYTGVPMPFSPTTKP
jgi:hypothetical protein